MLNQLPKSELICSAGKEQGSNSPNIWKKTPNISFKIERELIKETDGVNTWFAVCQCGKKCTPIKRRKTFPYKLQIKTIIINMSTIVEEILLRKAGMCFLGRKPWTFPPRERTVKLQQKYMNLTLKSGCRQSGGSLGSVT